MRLVVVATVLGDLSEPAAVIAHEPLGDALEAQHARERLGREPELLVEAPAQPTPAIAELAGQLADLRSAARVAEPPPGPGDRARHGRRLGEAPCELALDEIEATVPARLLVGPFEQHGGGGPAHGPRRRMRPAGGHFPRTQLRPVTPHLERLPWPVGHDASLARLARALGGFAPLPQLLPEPANRLGLLALGGAVELDELQEQIWILDPLHEVLEPLAVEATGPAHLPPNAVGAVRGAHGGEQALLVP